MSKELPFFRFTVSEWLNDDISLESYEMKGLFIDVCSFYWFKDCSITRALLEKRFSNAKAELKALLKLGIIKVKSNGHVSILFLDNQYDMLSEKRKNRQLAGKKGGLTKSSNAKAMLKQKSSYKDNNKDNNKEKEVRVLYDSFISQSNGMKFKDQYLHYIDYLFKSNELGKPLKAVLAKDEQIEPKYFDKLMEEKKEGVSILQTTFELNNYTVRKYKTFYSTLLNWVRR